MSISDIMNYIFIVLVKGGRIVVGTLGCQVTVWQWQMVYMAPGSGRRPLNRILLRAPVRSGSALHVLFL